MVRRYQLFAVCLSVALLGTACAGAGNTSPSRARQPEGQAPAAPKRITAAIHGELSHITGPGAAVPGREAVSDLVNTGLVNFNREGELIPRLTEQIPSVENGLWKVAPDGSMELVWKIRPGSLWHDRQPLSADDLVFTVRVGQDQELPEFGHVAYGSLAGIEAQDAQTVIVRWARPYIDADKMFSESFAEILPRHMLGRVYEENKASFTEDAYWTTGFVGTGAFKLRTWEPGSHIVLEAFAEYPLGRPKVDVVEVRFIADSATMAANILAGEVDLSLGRALTLEEALEVRNQWPGGKMDVGYKSWIAIFPQFINPSPAIILDVRFRRALLHAVDRQALAETFQGGLVPVAHSFLNPSQPQYREIEARLPKYDYDARGASDMLQRLGYTKLPDGSLQSPEGGKLEVEMRTIGVTADKAILAVADYWKQIGVGTEPVIIAPARTRDTPYRATFPGFQIFQNPNDVEGLSRLRAAQTPLPENNFRAIGNHSRYMDPEFNALLDRFYGTIPRAERTKILGEIIYHIADQLNLMGLYYGLEPIVISERVQNVTARHSLSTHAWNAHEWDVRAR